MNKVLIPTKLSDVAANTLKTAGYEVIQDADTPLDVQAASHPDTVALIVRSEKEKSKIFIQINIRRNTLSAKFHSPKLQNTIFISSFSLFHNF